MKVTLQSTGTGTSSCTGSQSVYVCAHAQLWCIPIFADQAFRFRGLLRLRPKSSHLSNTILQRCGSGLGQIWIQLTLADLGSVASESGSATLYFHYFAPLSLCQKAKLSVTLEL